MKQDLLEKLAKELPPIFEKQELDRLTGGVIRARTFSNLMSKGLASEGVHRIGRKVVIPRDEFLKWLADRMQPIEAKQVEG